MTARQIIEAASKPKQWMIIGDVSDNGVRSQRTNLGRHADYGMARSEHRWRYNPATEELFFWNSPNVPDWMKEEVTGRLADMGLFVRRTLDLSFKDDDGTIIGTQELYLRAHGKGVAY